MVLEWLIIGGGIHGVHVAHRLVTEAAIPLRALNILDPHPRLLSRWLSLTQRTGMTHLRSSSVHHLDVEPVSLRRYTSKNVRETPEGIAAWIHPYRRPALSLFNKHCSMVVRASDLLSAHIQGQAVSITRESSGILLVRFTSPRSSNPDSPAPAVRTLRTRKILLSPGSGQAGFYPEWATRQAEVTGLMGHVFDPEYSIPPRVQSIVLVGGGITAVRTALTLIKQGKTVTILCRHEPRIHQFDSDPAWIGPRNMRAFLKEPDMNSRRKRISQARHPGSIPPDVYHELQRALQDSSLSWLTDAVSSCGINRNQPELTLKSGSTITADYLLFATGFGSQRPGGHLVDSLVNQSGFPCAPCSYPLIDSHLHWKDNIHVSGGLAELELGPTARNIVGARRTGDRILASLGITARHAVDFT